VRQIQNKVNAMAKWDENWKEEEFCEKWRTPAPDVVNLVPILREHNVHDVLDLGCGVGRHSWLLAREGFNVTGTDDSPTAVEHCRRWLAAEGLDADFRVSDMMKIPGGPESLDAILAYNVIYHASRSEVIRIIATIRDALRPGGLFYGTFIDKNNPRFGIGREVERDTFVVDDGSEAGVPHYYIDESDLRELFGDFEILGIARLEQITHLHPEYPTSSKLAALARKA
jgi:SAM-dependent methyltransferase